MIRAGLVWNIVIVCLGMSCWGLLVWLIRLLLVLLALCTYHSTVGVVLGLL